MVAREGSLEEEGERTVMALRSSAVSLIKVTLSASSVLFVCKKNEEEILHLKTKKFVRYGRWQQTQL